VAANLYDALFERPINYLIYLPLPLVLTYQYLLEGMSGPVFFVLAIVGGIQLWVTGRRAALALCVAPLPLAYALRFAEMIPFGANRQSVYLFPFLHGLAAAALPAVLTGFGEIHRAWSRARERLAEPSARPAGVVAIAVIFSGFFYLSMGVLEGVVFHNRRIEHATTHADLDRSLALLKRRIGPNDLVLVSYQGLTAYQAHLHRAAMPYRPAEFMRVEGQGLSFYYSPEAGWFFSPASFVRAYYDVKQSEGLEGVERVWMIRGAAWPWEYSLRDWFHNEFPEVPLDDGVVIESRGWLFSVAAKDLDPLVAGVADVEGFYERDFTRSQFAREAWKAPEYFRP
jgi:hypothetical protein